MGCNQPQDHKLLAWLCIELAETFKGMIDLGGPLPISGGENAGRGKIPGTVLAEFYFIDEGRVGISHIVSPEFLRFWLNQPQFHMIK